MSRPVLTLLHGPLVSLLAHPGAVALSEQRGYTFIFSLNFCFLFSTTIGYSVSMLTMAAILTGMYGSKASRTVTSGYKCFFILLSN